MLFVGGNSRVTLVLMYWTAPIQSPRRLSVTWLLAIVIMMLLETFMPSSILCTLVSAAVSFLYRAIVWYALCSFVVYDEYLKLYSLE